MKKQSMQKLLKTQKIKKNRIDFLVHKDKYAVKFFKMEQSFSCLLK